MNHVQVVSSIEEEESCMGGCPCGGNWQLMNEVLVPLQGRWYDSLVSACPLCHTRSSFLFDVTPFFRAHPRVWACYGVVADT